MGSCNGRHLWQRSRPKLSPVFGMHRHDVSATGQVDEEHTFFWTIRRMRVDAGSDKSRHPCRTQSQTTLLVDSHGRNGPPRNNFLGGGGDFAIVAFELSSV